MQLDRIAIRLRAREPWEAVDLGAVLLRTWWRPVYGALVAVVLPATLLLHLMLISRPWLALLLTWWLKPLYDRVVLHVLAHAVFGAPPDVRDTLKRLPALLGATGLAEALLWGRAEAARAFNLPIRQLEGQRGSAARARRLVLGRRVATQASGVLYMCLMFEALVMISLVSLVDLATPATVDAQYGLKAFFRQLMEGDASGWHVYVNHAFYVLAMCAIEPLYVAGSFALYLNRRTSLEAWDLELSFRRMAERAAASRRPKSVAAALALVIGLACLPVTPEANAADRAPQDVIREVLASPEFQEYRKEKTWQRRTTDDAEPSQRDFRALAELFQFVSELFAGLVRFAAYAFLAIGAFLLLRYLALNIDRFTLGRRRDRPRVTPAVLFGLDVRPEALPDNLAQAALAVADTDPRLALSLLYRGALATLIHRDRIDFAAGDTESDCVRRVERSAPATLGAYFRRLVAAWSQAAYAHRMADVQAIRALCAEWPDHFNPGAASA